VTLASEVDDAAMDPLLAVVIVIVLVLVAAMISEAYAERRDRRRHPPPGQLVDVGGHRLHVHVTGEPGSGAPTVILDSGMVSFSSNWAWVQGEIAKVTRVVAYDRAGLGWSDMGRDAHDAGANAKQLAAALQSLGVSGPYVLAGHSYGGLSLRAFAARHRDEIAGMVLVDASHPEQWKRFGISSKVLGWGNRVSSVVARLGVFRVFNGEYRLLATGLPERAYAELMAFSSTPRALSASGQAAMAWDDVTRPLVNDAGDLGDMPLIVLSVTEQPRKAKELTELQAELATLSTNCRHLTIQGAYHEALLADQAHARVVTESIVEVLEAVRTGTPLAQQPGG
jgi:pimeloyl-ACP methyl ester carboxylesterase